MNRVALFRDPTSGWHVTHLPPWIAPETSKPGRYWHQPRSASMYDGRLCVHFWCGQSSSVAQRRLSGTPPEAMKCGTCLGRRMGFEGEDGAVFKPRDWWALPSRCPGVTWEPPEFKVCLACGEKVQAARGWNAWGSARHRPGSALAERVAVCPRHGWRDMHERDGGFRCVSFQCGWTSAVSIPFNQRQAEEERARQERREAAERLAQ